MGIREENKLIYLGEQWFQSQKWTAFPFQKNTWSAYLNGKSGLVNAPTGSGKTYSLFIAAALEFIRQNPTDFDKEKNGLQLIWITPIRALAKEIHGSCSRATRGLGLNWNIEIRSGDTTATNRAKQWKNPPEMLITTPESLHVMMATKGYKKFFSNVKTIVVDEWHELLGSKRGVQTELVISCLNGLQKNLKVWGISATIGNMQEAIDVLLCSKEDNEIAVIKANINKDIEVKCLIPDEIERYPWSGHLGLKMLPQVLPIIHKSGSTLIFTNTRAQCDIWYQSILHADPDLAGIIAMHHGSVSKNLREWVEEALYDGRLKAVVCTSSLDLGVDFRPVETIVQIGSPKGVSRFIQRAGRSGHQPGAKSVIHFLPTHAIEMVECAALRSAIKSKELEDRVPYIRSFDVLIQYLMTLAVSEGFDQKVVYNQIIKTYCYSSISEDEWLQILNFLVHGSQSLQAYDEYQKVEIEDGLYIVKNRRIAQRHKMSIGTIVSDAMMDVRFLSGKRVGSVEEVFIAQLSPGDVFWFAGRCLELIRVKDMIAQVKASKKKSKRIPSYMGGRISLSSMMSKALREKLYEYVDGKTKDKEVLALKPLFDLQEERSLIPKKDEFLIEYFESDEGYHLLMYPFEGRYVHEGIAALIAERISRQMPISFSLGMNDYGFELLSDKKINLDVVIHKGLFDTKDLSIDIQSTINGVEMARRQFRDVARISGLIFQGFPGKRKKNRHLQSSSQLIFNVFKDYEPDSLLYQQTFDEVMTFQLEEARMRNVLDKIRSQHFIISRPEKATPFSFPIIVDRLREKMSSEKLTDRIAKMTLELEK
ncbi:MAG: ligase-associated DNA damage response DEXH box helicase [Saprospiraceae bacterium]|nr:ligase-associated DNA damage response DEXH box helicase [Saprospiraceae bacterium]